MTLPSLAESVQRIVVQMFPWLPYSFPRTYVVAAVHPDNRLDIRPPAGPSGIGLDPINNVEQGGLGVVTPAVGTEVCCIFRDADKRRPLVIGWAFKSTGGGGDADRVDLDNGSESLLVGTEAGRVVRYGDVVMMPSGPAATPTGVVLLGAKVGDTPAPVGPVSASRVKA